MSLEELMEVPEYSVLTTHLGDSYDEYTLTCDAFIKFQVRRQGNDNAGVEPFKKNIIKIIGRNISQLDAVLEGLVSDTVNYIRHRLWSSELYVLHTTELKDKITANASAVMLEVKSAFAAADDAGVAQAPVTAADTTSPAV